MAEPLIDWDFVRTQRVQGYRWIQLAATVRRNFDANGSPCEEPAEECVGKCVVEVILLKPVDYIKITGEIK